MLLRLQKAAARDLRAEDVLAETINRILSIAAVHETLSEQGLRVVDVKDVMTRVTRAIAETMLGGGQDITITVEGDRLVLPSREATSLALATSELVQNAVKHAFVGRARGMIRVRLESAANENVIIVQDNGIGADKAPGASKEPALSLSKGLGLQIIHTLVNDDLKGKFELHHSAEGTRAVVRFPRAGDK
jgi:two-component sensor histidine kinase